MKKLYSLTIAIAFTTTLCGQLVNQKLYKFETEKTNVVKTATIYPNDKSVNNDQTASEGFYGFGSNLIQYTQIPFSQISSAYFSIKVTNNGLVDQTNTILTADINNGLFTGTSAPIMNNVGITDSLFTTTQYVPAPFTSVQCDITLTVSSDSIDATPTDNTTSFSPIWINNTIYSHHDYGLIDGNGGGYNYNVTPATEDFEAGNYFDFVNYQANDVGIFVTIGSNTQVGSAIDAFVYEIDSSGNFIEIFRSNVKIITVADIANDVWFVPTNGFEAGKTYFVGVHAWGGIGSEFFYATNGTSVDNTAPSGATSLLYYPNMTNPNMGEAFYTTQTPKIWLEFGFLPGINEVETNININVYPNPSNGIFNVVINSIENTPSTLTVTNTLGEILISKNIKLNEFNKETISLTNFSKGIYFLTVGGTTKKLIYQ